jgi:hypothetical protein
MRPSFGCRAVSRSLSPRCRLGLIVASLLLPASGCTSTSPDQSAVWGSDQANLTIVDTSATLRIVAAGGCYGSYGEFDQPPSSGAFSRGGTYTQLIGFYPGQVQYAAQFSGTVSGRQISLTVTVPALQGTVGPFTLTQGRTAKWPACLYP